MGLKADLKASTDKCAAGPDLAAETGNRNIAALLTRAENRVLALVTQAKTNKEIARVLGISPATVKRHLENVLRKLSVKNRVEAAIYGILANGCPGAIAASCALQSWRKERGAAESIWAD